MNIEITKNHYIEQEQEDIELDLFLQALYRFHGHDFRHYVRESIKRQVIALVESRSLNSISELIPLIIHHPDYQATIINDLTISYSMLFREPDSFKLIQEKILPYLRSFARLQIWIAGCANGEEAYSLAILLHEAGLLERSLIYATDVNSNAIATAKNGVLTHALNAEVNDRYRLASGQDNLLDYFTLESGKHKLKQEFLSKIHFQTHNLAQQPGIITAELIMCRNVLLYFNPKLQKQALNYLANALIGKGYLITSEHESINHLINDNDFISLEKHAGIYQKPFKKHINPSESCPML